jgi:hypothetical protein
MPLTTLDERTTVTCRAAVVAAVLSRSASM